MKKITSGSLGMKNLVMYKGLRPFNITVRIVSDLCFNSAL